MTFTDLICEDCLKGEKLEYKPTRDGLGDALVSIGEKDENVVALNADLEGSVRHAAFADKFPDRSFQVGVAEQNMASIALGLALYGKVPFFSSFAAFSPGINFSQIRLALISGANIKIASTHYGLNIGPDGVTAQMLSDVSMMRALPTLVIITPVDYRQAIQAVWEAYKYQGPVYLRFTREKFPIFMKEDSHFEIGKGQVLREGTDVTIISTGSMVYSAIEASKTLADAGIFAEIINIHTIKPIDRELIISSAEKTNAVLTFEEHQIYGGLGSAVAEVLGQYRPTKMKIIGVNDEFGETGSSKELLESRGLTAEKLVEHTRNFLQK